MRVRPLLEGPRRSSEELLDRRVDNRVVEGAEGEEAEERVTEVTGTRARLST